VAIAEFSLRWQEPFRRFLGADPTGDARWSALQRRLGAVPSVYANGLLTYYVAIPPRPENEDGE
jgi:hypothetical protein